MPWQRKNACCSRSASSPPRSVGCHSRKTATLAAMRARVTHAERLVGFESRIGSSLRSPPSARTLPARTHARTDLGLRVPLPILASMTTSRITRRLLSALTLAALLATACSSSAAPTGRGRLRRRRADRPSGHGGRGLRQDRRLERARHGVHHDDLGRRHRAHRLRLGRDRGRRLEHADGHELRLVPRHARRLRHGDHPRRRHHVHVHRHVRSGRRAHRRPRRQGVGLDRPRRRGPRVRELRGAGKRDRTTPRRRSST